MCKSYDYLYVLYMIFFRTITVWFSCFFVHLMFIWVSCDVRMMLFIQFSYVFQFISRNFHMMCVCFPYDFDVIFICLLVRVIFHMKFVCCSHTFHLIFIWFAYDFERNHDGHIWHILRKSYENRIDIIWKTWQAHVRTSYENQTKKTRKPYETHMKIIR